MARSEGFHAAVSDDTVAEVITESVDDGDVAVAEVDVVHDAHRSALSILPLLLGVFVLAVDAYLLFRFQAILFQKNLQNGTTLALILGSAIIGVFLIAYSRGVGRAEHAVATRWASPFVVWVVVPLLLGILALGAPIWGMEWNRSIAERGTPKSCIELYQQAQNIAKDNPRFRMWEKDRDEVRCSINAAIGR